MMMMTMMENMFFSLDPNFTCIIGRSFHIIPVMHTISIVCDGWLGLQSII